MAVDVELSQLDFLQTVLENIEGAQIRIDWINQQGPISPEDIFTFVKDTNGNVIRVIANQDGTIRSTYQTSTSISSLPNNVTIANSNAPNMVVKTRTPLSTVLSEQSKVQFEGMGNFTLKSVGQAVAAVSTGIALGKVIDDAIYKYYPADTLFGIDIANFDTSAWGSITEGETGVGAWAFNHLFHINPETNAVQEYADADEIAYMARYLSSKNILSEQGKITPSPDADPQVITDYFPAIQGSGWQLIGNLVAVIDEPGICYGTSMDGIHSFTFYSDTPRQVEYITADPTFQNVTHHTLNLHAYSYKSKVVYHTTVAFSVPGIKEMTGVVNNRPAIIGDEELSGRVAWAAMYGTIEKIPGVSDEPGAHVLNLPEGLTQEQALTYIQENMPELWSKAVIQDVVQPDGSTKQYAYLPIPTVLPSINNEVVTGQASQLAPEVTPDSAPSIIKQIQDYLADINLGMNPTPSDTGTGSTIPVVFPVSHSLWAIYNPSQSEIDAFGAWLWSDNPIEQIKKIFANPMDAVIGVHKVFVNPPVAGRRNIKAGYLDSGVNSNYIGAQYVEVDCGTVYCTEYFGNVFDYYPHTNLELYLPFVGIVQLDPADVMRSSINVKYGVDVLTGDCLAMVTINRDGYSGILYSYPGNCAVRYPVTGGTYISALASIAANAVLLYGGMAPTVPLKSANVQHSGSFQGNCGATGPKIPYLIIRRPQTLLAPTFPGIEGVPSNHSDLLGNYTGFVKVLDCHLDTICATSAELDMISELLKEGIIV